MVDFKSINAKLLFISSQHIGRFLKLFHSMLSWTFAIKEINTSIQCHHTKSVTASQKNISFH